MNNKDRAANLILSVICNQSFDEFYDGEFEEWIVGESELSGEEIVDKIKDLLPTEWAGLYINEEPPYGFTGHKDSGWTGPIVM